MHRNMVNIEIPAKFEVTTRRNNEDTAVTVQNDHPGRISLPDAWTGKDWGEYPSNAPGKEPMWLLQWQWAKARVIEWKLNDVPSNPNQIKDNDLPWHLLNYVVKAVYGAMSEYGRDNRDGWFDNGLNMPEPEQLTAGQFLGYYNEAQETGKEPKGNRVLSAFREYSPFVRQWPEGVEHAPDGMAVDLSLILAVVDRGNEILTTAADLGNLLAPPGGRFTPQA